MKISYINIALRTVGYIWSFIALVITWVSDWAIISGKTQLFGVHVFDVKDSYSLALLLFPGAFSLLVPYILEKYFSIGLTKKAAIKQYSTKLSSLLSIRYGRSESYSYGQVKRTILENRLSQSYMLYAFAMYLDLKEYDKNVQDVDKSNMSYMELRDELTNNYFTGKQNIDGHTLCDSLSQNSNSVGHNSTSDGGSD